MMEEIVGCKIDKRDQVNKCSECQYKLDSQSCKDYVSIVSAEYIKEKVN